MNDEWNLFSTKFSLAEFQFQISTKFCRLIITTSSIRSLTNYFFDISIYSESVFSINVKIRRKFFNVRAFRWFNQHSSLADKKTSFVALKITPAISIKSQRKWAHTTTSDWFNCLCFRAIFFSSNFRLSSAQKSNEIDATQLAIAVSHQQTIARTRRSEIR